MGEIRENQRYTRQEPITYFEQLPKVEDSPHTVHVCSLIRRVGNKIIKEQSSRLMASITEVEIQSALSFMNVESEKPNPDGFIAHFFKQYWGIVKVNFIKVVQ